MTNGRRMPQAGSTNLSQPKEAAMKLCAQCHGKLGLGVRSRNVGNGRWRVHVRFCSAHCEALHELERYEAKGGLRAFTPRTSPQTRNECADCARVPL
jgi:hypothetical protein